MLYCALTIISLLNFKNNKELVGSSITETVLHIYIYIFLFFFEIFVIVCMWKWGLFSRLGSVSEAPSFFFFNGKLKKSAVPLTL